MAFLALNRFAGTGTVMQFEINFAGNTDAESAAGTAPYFNVADVQASIVTLATVDSQESSVPVPLTQINTSTFRTTAIVPVGKQLWVRRATENKHTLVDFRALQTVTEENLDELARQNVFLVQEATDTANVALEVSHNAEQLSIEAAARIGEVTGQVEEAAENAEAAAIAAGQAAQASAQAVQAANNATAVAGAVDGKASTALTNSSTALTRATEAKATADAVDGKASTALTQSTQAAADSAEAIQKADAVNGIAEEARTLAQAASDKVDQLEDPLPPTAGNVGKFLRADTGDTSSWQDPLPTVPANAAGYQLTIAGDGTTKGWTAPAAPPSGSGYKVGDVVYAPVAPDATFLPCDGQARLSAAFSELAAKLTRPAEYGKVFASVHTPGSALRAICTNHAGTWLAFTDSTQYKSTDNGQTWAAKSLSGITEVRAAYWAANGTVIICGRSGGGALQRSTNAGDTWVANTGIVVTYGALDNLTAYGQGGEWMAIRNSSPLCVIHSSDDGITWNPRNATGPGASTTATAVCMLQSPPNAYATIMPAFTGTVLVGAADGAMYLHRAYANNDVYDRVVPSGNNGTTPTPLPIAKVVGQVYDGTSFAFSSQGVFWASRDRRVTEFKQEGLMPWGLKTINLIGVAVGPVDCFFVASSTEGVARTQNAGRTWDIWAPPTVAGLVPSCICSSYGDGTVMIGTNTNAIFRALPYRDYDASTQFKTPLLPAYGIVKPFIKAST